MLENTIVSLSLEILEDNSNYFSKLVMTFQQDGVPPRSYGPVKRYLWSRQPCYRTTRFIPTRYLKSKV